LPAQAFVTMEIYNILGVKVRTLLQGAVMSAGIHQMEWNGKDDAGASVTSGVYLYRINAGTFQVTKKMMMLK
jgi:flagellar hook assembly protein FlgD